MLSNGTFVATLFDATSQLALTNSQISYVANGTYTNLTHRLGDYFMASDFQYNDTVNNISKAGIITLF